MGEPASHPTTVFANKGSLGSDARQVGGHSSARRSFKGTESAENEVSTSCEEILSLDAGSGSVF